MTEFDCLSLPNVTIDLGAVRENFRRVAAAAAVPLIAVVKADAYGHGATRVASAIHEEAGCAGFAVARIEEAIALREAGCRRSILVFGFFPGASTGANRTEYLEAFSEYRLEPCISSRHDLDCLAAATTPSYRRGLRWHLEFDTGMNRAGLSIEQLEGLPEWLGAHDLRPQTVFSHFVESERELSAVTAGQIERFRMIADQWRKAEFCGGSHLSNSAAVLQFGSCGGTLARPGGALFGLDLLTGERTSLRPVMRVVTRLVAVREVARGESVGYGGRWRASSRQRIGLIPIGYADGLSPVPPTCAPVGGAPFLAALIGGRKAPVIGNVSMDLTVVDLNGRPDAAVGDEVVVLGRQGHENISAFDLARGWGTVAYDVTCRMSRRARRVFVDDR